MTTCVRRLTFDYGHRVLGHGGQCAHLHGHRGVAEVECEAESLNDLGMVIDFAVIKELIGGWIQDNWDHNFLCHPDDLLVELYRNKNYALRDLEDGAAFGMFAGKAPFVMPAEFANPTAENMAAVLLGEARRLLYPLGIRVVRVRLAETDNCYAEVK